MCEESEEEEKKFGGFFVVFSFYINLTFLVLNICCQTRFLEVQKLCIF